jgi:hypothetical protein
MDIYANEIWVLSDSRPDDVSDEPLFGSLQFTVLEVLNPLLDLDSNKGLGPLILKSCASALALPLDRWKLSFATPIFKSGNRNDLSNYRDIAILSTAKIGVRWIQSTRTLLRPLINCVIDKMRVD